MSRTALFPLVVASGLAFAGSAAAATYQYRQYLPGFTGVAPQSTTPAEVIPPTPEPPPTSGTPDLLYSISLVGDTTPINLGSAAAVKITKVVGGAPPFMHWMLKASSGLGQGPAHQHPFMKPTGRGEMWLARGQSSKTVPCGSGGPFYLQPHGTQREALPE